MELSFGLLLPCMHPKPYTPAGKPIDPKDMKAIEDMVVGLVTASLPVYAREASLEEAKKIIGLRAVFGEVRVEQLLMFL